MVGHIYLSMLSLIETYTGLNSNQEFRRPVIPFIIFIIIIFMYISPRKLIKTTNAQKVVVIYEIRMF